MSFQIGITPNRRASTRFIGKVRRALIQLLAENEDVSRTQIADAIGVHRSVITRQLNGQADMNVGRIAEIAWALGYRAVIDFEKVAAADGGNVPTTVAPAYRNVAVHSQQASANDVMVLSQPSRQNESVKSMALAE